MKAFRVNQRIIVINGKSRLCGKCGTVERIQMCDGGAWVEMDEELPVGLATFEKGDHRHNYTLLYPAECNLMSNGNVREACDHERKMEKLLCEVSAYLIDTLQRNEGTGMNYESSLLDSIIETLDLPAREQPIASPRKVREASRKDSQPVAMAANF